MISTIVQRLDQHFDSTQTPRALSGMRRFACELWYFGLKEARACLFAGLFFAAVFVVPRAGVFGVPRYDMLLIIALVIQIWMIASKLETLDEFKAIMLFHLMGFALEAFKVSAYVRSWSYPDFAYTKVLGVPLFSGFMYAAIGSYLIQVWRVLDMRVERHPPYWMTGLVAVLLYLNFYTHRYMGDYRWLLGALALGLYARCEVVFRPLDRDRRMPLVAGLILVGFFIWLAENIGTFFGLWRYPNQMGAWATVHLGKWSSWTALVLLTFSIVVNLKHIKARVQLAQ
jgi:uncharacterized membrane protein YoaT (DUF817 family)